VHPFYFVCNPKKRSMAKWTRDHTIVALSTYHSVPFNKANNNHPDIVSCSKIIDHTAVSVKMKIGNFGSLDPELAKRGIVGLTGATNLDKEIWAEFYGDRQRLALETAAAIARLTNTSVEGFLDEVEEKELPEGKVKPQVTNTRVNQWFFRRSILGIYDKCCCVTGLRIPKLLVASHIVPWAKDLKNALNPENGLCLNSFHDKAFDSGLITISADYKVQLSPRLKDFPSNDATVIFFQEFDGTKILLPERHYPNGEFLEYHRAHIFEK